MNELFEFKDAILTVHLPQDLDHPQSDWIRKETDRIMSRTYVKRIVLILRIRSLWTVLVSD